MTVKSICIVGLDAWSVLAPGPDVPYVGGESVQQVLLARAFRDLGLDVSLIVHDEGQPHDQMVEGIRVITVCSREAGMRVVRFVHPRMTSLLGALRKADADVYYQSPAGVNTGVVAWFCRRNRRRFVFRVASDANCIPGQQLITYWRDRKLFEYGMRRADLIAAQTVRQQRLLKENYGLKSAVVNMAADVDTPRPQAGKDIDALWVSNYRDVKRPEAVVDLAKALPQVTFSMVGGPMPGGESYYERVTAALRQLPNVTVHGAVPYQDVGKLYDRAKLFLNTSTMEGFPNTFLQAWMRGLPVVSTFDPDDLIKREALGGAADSPEGLIPHIRATLADPAALEVASARLHDYAMREFSGVGVARRYLDLLNAG
ncbi:MAG: glycosyltransferase family 4 protein [Steroidobacteraceae bacterium]